MQCGCIALYPVPVISIGGATTLQAIALSVSMCRGATYTTVMFATHTKDVELGLDVLPQN